MTDSMTRGQKILAGVNLPRGNRISVSKASMIIGLHRSGHKPSVIAHSLGVSRTTVYYHLHPEKYQEKIDYMKRFRSKWVPEPDIWELEDG